MRQRVSVGTFTIGDRIREQIRTRTTLELAVVQTPLGWTVTDRTHLRFVATYRTQAEADGAAVLAMARRLA